MRRCPTLLAVAAATIPLVGSAFAQTKSAPAGSSSSATSAASLAASVANRARTVGSSFRTYEADFDQQDTLVATNQTAWMQGHLTFERGSGTKPDKMRWEYTTPAGDLVVSDGATAWSYFAAKSIAHKRLPAGSYLPLVLSLVAGHVDLVQNFQLTLKPNGAGGFYVLDAKPNVATTYDRLILYFDTSGFHLRRVVVMAQGNRYRFDFSHSQLNPIVSPTSFRWSPPAHVTVVP